VRPTIFGRRRAERFAQLLDQSDQPDGELDDNATAPEPGAGRVDDSAQYDTQAEPLYDERDPASQHDADLHDELSLVRALSATGAQAPTPSPQFRMELRAMLVAEAERQQMANAAAVNEPTRVLPLRLVKDLGSSQRRKRRRGRRTRAAVIVGLAVGTLAVSGISVASGSAMPGDALYGVKRSSEDARVALAGSDRDRGSLYLQFARNRMGEARGISGTSGLFALLGTMDQDTSMGTALLTRAALRQGDARLLDPLAQFVVDQQRDLGNLARGSTDVRRLTIESLELLTKVNDRIDAVRAAIACHAAYADDNQPLGPTVQPCG